MWETIKKDPLIKTVVVIILGVIAFGLAFNIMFGAGGSAMEEGSMGMSTGYSLGNTLEAIISILIKVVIIGLLIGAVVWIFRTVTKSNGTGQTSAFSFLKEDPIIKNALIIIGAVVVLMFVFSFLRGSPNAGYTGGEMAEGYSGYSGSGFSFNLQSVLSILIKVLILISVLGLGYGILMYLKEHYQKAASITKKSADSDTVVCPECKSELAKNWTCCPFCGSEKAFDKNITKD